MGRPQPDYLAPEAYIEGELTSDIRHEYVNGLIEAMVGASRRHNILSVTLASVFRGHLKGSGCTTFVSDMKVRIKTHTDDKFYYPDVMVSCDQNPTSQYYEENPVLIAEVLSDSTAMRDKLEKRDAYSNINSLVEYLLVAQDKAEIEVVSFGKKGVSSCKYSQGESIKLVSVELDLAVNDVYEGLSD